MMKMLVRYRWMLAAAVCPSVCPTFVGARHFGGRQGRQDRLNEIRRLRALDNRPVNLKEFAVEWYERAVERLRQQYDLFDDRLVRDLNKEYRKLSRQEVELMDKDKFAIFKVIWKFSDPQSMQHWYTTTDYDNYEGYSSCTFTQTNIKTALFSGYLDTTVPKDGLIDKSGYCNVCSKKMYVDSPYISFFWDKRRLFEWSGYSHLVMRCRGDGRTYSINFHCPVMFDLDKHDMFQYTLHTRGGPYWQITRIPFTKFVFCSRGHIQDRQYTITPDEVSQVSITCADRKVGNFSLEIDYIGLGFDPTQVDETDYEHYDIQGVVY